MRKPALLLPLLAGLLMGLTSDDLRRDMVRLDKVYIAALALSSQGKVAETRRAMEDLTRTWRAFSERHRGANPADAQWPKDFDDVAQRIGEAAAIATSERKLTDAHEALEEVRVVMAQLRARNGIEYFVDHLTAFHEPMEDIVLVAKDKTAAQLHDGDVARIRALLPEAEARWERVVAAPFSAADYELDAEAYARARRHMQLEREALAELSAALGSGDRTRIQKAAVGIKPNFAALFMTFADFAPYRN